MLHELSSDASAAGLRLDVWLQGRLDGCSRSLIERAIKRGLCRVEPGKAKPGYRLRGRELISISLPEIEPLEAVAEDIPLRVLHEDAWLIAVDKPAGMVVHPAIGHARGTLVNALLGRYGTHLAGEPWRPGIVHRLDADTSGVIVVAKTLRALDLCQQAFRERRVGKLYLALIHGRPKADVLECRAPLGRHPKDFRKRTVLPPGATGAKEAQTTIVVRQRHSGYCVVEARPHTGRTHQVRVHCAHLGHPLLADEVYGRSGVWQVSGAGPHHLARHALHAWRLRFPHPAGGTMEITAPIPDDLRPWIDGLIVPLG